MPELITFSEYQLTREKKYYHAIKDHVHIETGVDLELTEMESHHGHLNVVMASSTTSLFTVQRGEKVE